MRKNPHRVLRATSSPGSYLKLARARARRMVVQLIGRCMHKRTAVLLTTVAVLLSACGGDGGSGPSEPANIAGSWRFEAHDITMPGAAEVCGMTGSLVFEQTGETLSGEYTIDRIMCTGPGGGTTEGPFIGPIVSGSVSGNKVHFHFDTEDLDQHGTVSGDRMTGTCTWSGDGDGWMTMTGKWSAQRM